jgi:hypothetical protein
MLYQLIIYAKHLFMNLLNYNTINHLLCDYLYTLLQTLLVNTNQCFLLNSETQGVMQVTVFFSNWSVNEKL